MINVSELIEDPDFTQINGVNIIRSTYEIVNHEPQAKEVELNVPGIITINSDTSLLAFLTAAKDELTVEDEVLSM